MQFVIGLIAGASTLALLQWIRSRNVFFKWYEFLAGILGFFLLTWSVHDFFASLKEFNEIAAWTFLWCLSVPGLLLLSVAVLLPWLRYHRSRRLATK